MCQQREAAAGGAPHGGHDEQRTASEEAAAPAGWKGEEQEGMKLALQSFDDELCLARFRSSPSSFGEATTHLFFFFFTQLHPK